LRFFFDNNVSPRIAAAISILATQEKDEVTYLSKRFPEDALDVQWIPVLAAEGKWIIISGDEAIQRRPAERKVFSDAKLTTFFLASAWPRAPFWDQAYFMVRWWPRIREFAQHAPAGTVVQIPFGASGKFKETFR